MRNPQLGEMEIFLVPIGADQAAARSKRSLTNQRKWKPRIARITRMGRKKKLRQECFLIRVIRVIRVQNSSFPVSGFRNPTLPATPLEQQVNSLVFDLPETEPFVKLERPVEALDVDRERLASCPRFVLQIAQEFCANSRAANSGSNVMSMIRISFSQRAT